MAISDTRENASSDITPCVFIVGAVPERLGPFRGGQSILGSMKHVRCCTERVLPSNGIQTLLFECDVTNLLCKSFHTPPDSQVILDTMTPSEGIGHAELVNPIADHRL